MSEEIALVAGMKLRIIKGDTDCMNWIAGPVPIGAIGVVCPFSYWPKDYEKSEGHRGWLLDFPKHPIAANRAKYKRVLTPQFCTTENFELVK